MCRKHCSTRWCPIVRICPLDPSVCVWHFTGARERPRSGSPSCGSDNEAAVLHDEPVRWRSASVVVRMHAPGGVTMVTKGCQSLRIPSTIE